MKVGLVVNPLAGIGGTVALKGSDGDEVVAMALAAGASKKAPERVSMCLQQLDAETVTFLTAGGEMGEKELVASGFECSVVYTPSMPTKAIDTQSAVEVLCNEGVELLLFAGGDGTARDVLDALSRCKRDAPLPVLGIPAGCKIHSAVYALTPVHAGELLALLAEGQPMSLVDARVMDLDEDAFRHGQVQSRCYGYLSVPVDDTRMQLSKQGGIDNEVAALDDIAAEIIETMQPDVLYIIGSGTTTEAIMQQLGLPNTLLGIDVILNNQLLANDVTEEALLQILAGGGFESAKIIVTVIGGQGHILGRGNQQLSAKVLQQVGIGNIMIIATNEKLRRLGGRPLIVDTGDSHVNQQLSGLHSVITGYGQKVLVKIA